jgi:ATP-dependent helicase/nuclease subunit A
MTQGAESVDAPIVPPASRYVLTDEQEQAVARRSEPLLLAAGAGSGKTSVLVERFVRAVGEDGVAPGKILAITFTERAAGELRERVRERFLQLGEREAARDTEAAFVSTFHGFCARLLRAHALAAGLEPEFEILEEGLAGRLRERAFAIALRSFLVGERAEAVDLLAAYGPDRARAIVEGLYAELRSRGERLPTLPRPALADDADGDDRAGARACALLDELLTGFGRAYDARKRARGAVDFDDLELRAAQLLRERADVRAAWSERFELLMVDEFQDTSPRQLAILAALERENLFTVGDELQSIYGFRHAQVSLFRARRAQLAEHGRSLELARNFRGRAPLLEVVNAVFAQRFGPGFTPLIAAREDAADGDDGGSEPRVELLLTSRRGWNGEEERPVSATPRWRHAEADVLARRVAELVAAGAARAGEVVVLLRAVGDLEVYERALQACGLRTLAAVGGFWERREVGDLLAYLRVLANPLDELALYGTLASPLVGCSSDGLALLARAAGAAKRGVWATVGDVEEEGGVEEDGEGLAPRAVRAPGARLSAAQLLARLPAGDRAALTAFRSRLQAERRMASRRTLSQLIDRALEASGYREHVLEREWGERRLANIHKLLRLARDFEASEGRDLRGFLDHVASLRAPASGGASPAVEPDAPVADVEPDAVRLMSIHAAKGLEFPVVCVADLGRAPNTGVPDLLVDGERIGLRLARLDGAEAIPSLEFDELCQDRKREQAEEEERIIYVAMTRARERLILSGAVDFERWPEPRQGAPTISWLGPALVADLPALAQELAQPVHDLPVGTSGRVRVRCRLNTPATVVMGPRIEAQEGLVRADGVAVAEPPTASGAARQERTRTSVGRPDALGSPDAFGSHDAPSRPDMASLPDTASRSDTASLPDDEASPPKTTNRPDTLSYTALAELERCGYRYYLERVLGLPENRAAARGQAGRDGLQARVRGTLVHRLLEDVDFARPIAPTAEDVALSARALGARVEQDEREEIAALVGSAVGSELLARIAAATGVRREHPFAFATAPSAPLLSGVIDLLAREADGSRLVVDYKSDRVSGEDDLEALVERDYGVQRLIYALAVLRDGARRVEVVHWFLERPREWVTTGYTADDLPALEARLEDHVRRAQAGTFDVSQTPHRSLCLTCPGRGGLCSWSEADTMVES